MTTTSFSSFTSLTSCIGWVIHISKRRTHISWPSIPGFKYERSKCTDASSSRLNIVGALMLPEVYWAFESSEKILSAAGESTSEIDMPLVFSGRTLICFLSSEKNSPGGHDQFLFSHRNSLFSTKCTLFYFFNLCPDPPILFLDPPNLFPAFYVRKASGSSVDLGQLKHTGSDGRR